ncbi:pyridoxamine 5'-phosphate oxidase family protein [Jannaschia sp. M317]|uniref:pyridoxamine 5'-phosphate oxidase family protein n=1 Tax=Jannaschia sp. M317 TaxID=2867011 RepID=UPI0021A37753|nr:pyridoxamine 5'-phosphate oxidase family protein [Jannaschia sp. M317]UWQ16875.1 pyridoxamine 5'-phosphate oxidase family protein [Jannaschia sp. M317]
MRAYDDIMFGAQTRALQEAASSREANAARYRHLGPRGLGPDEWAFLADRTSIYIASLTEEGWPYIQHRGGPKGFLRQVGPQTIGMSDYRGNRQFITQGNLIRDDRVSVFAMDYARKARLKIQGRARMVPVEADVELAGQVAVDGQGRVERLLTIEVEATDWNCPQFITPHFDEAQIAAMLGPEISRQQDRIKSLEARLRALGETP